MRLVQEYTFIRTKLNYSKINRNFYEELISSLLGVLRDIIKVESLKLILQELDFVQLFLLIHFESDLIAEINLLCLIG